MCISIGTPFISPPTHPPPPPCNPSSASTQNGARLLAIIREEEGLEEGEETHYKVYILHVKGIPPDQESQPPDNHVLYILQNARGLVSLGRGHSTHE